MSMPKTIELPTASDFCRHQLFEDGGEKCCFIGWQIMLLPKMNEKEARAFEKEAMKVAKKMKLKLPTSLIGSGMSNYNDCRENSKRRLATWFRKTIEELGYEIS